MGVFKVPMNVVALSAPDNTRLVAIAAGIEEKFNKLFGYFATCHLYFNSSKEVDTDAPEWLRISGELRVPGF